jgi:hypothetical protein
MKETAVEFLVDEFKEKLIGHNLPEWVEKIIEQAKAMEKEQMKALYTMHIVDTRTMELYDFDEYYNETFKSE